MARNTDLDWCEIGENEPFHGVITHPDFLKANITAEGLERFWASGQHEVRWQLDTLRAHYGPFEPKTAIDFGCGVGRLSRAMSPGLEKLYGVDISPGMLAQARIGAPDNIEFLTTIPDVQVDWINSMIVFQHLPPVKGIALLKDLLARLRKGGGITVHLTFFRSLGTTNMRQAGVHTFRWDGDMFRPLTGAEDPGGGMNMYDYDLNQVMAILIEAGISRFTVQHTDHGGYHGGVILGRKG